MDQSLTQMKLSIMRLHEYLPNLSQTPEDEPLHKYFDNVIDLVLATFTNYEHCLQEMQGSLRKHIKNEIELKIYYEHLESVISELKIQKKNQEDMIEQLRIQIQSMKEKEKFYQTLTNQNTKNNEEPSTKLDTKIDTLTKIKHRLSLNNTGEFMQRHIEKEDDTRDLHSKRESLAKALKSLYEKPSIKSRDSSYENSSRKCKKRSNSKNASKKQLQIKQTEKSRGKEVKSRNSNRKSREKIGPKLGKEIEKSVANKSGVSSRKNSVH